MPAPLTRHAPASPRERWSRAGAAALGVLGVLSLSGPPAHAAPATPVDTGSTSTVTLPTGERVTVHRGVDGRTMTSLADRPDGRSYLTERKGDDSYLIPTSAVRYLDRGLDPGLFDVTALARDGASGRIPLKLTFGTVDRQTPPPGVTLTGTTGSSIRDGYLTPAGAREFGRALAGAAGTGGTPFAGVTSVSYAGSHAAPVVRPQFPMRTVTLNVTGPDGKPVDDARAYVVNTDDSRKYAAGSVAVNGQDRISVPDGHYGLAVLHGTTQGQKLISQQVLFDNFTVSGAGTTVNLDLRKATNKVAIASTPKPAEFHNGTLYWYRGSSDNSGLLFGFELVPNKTMLSTGPVEHGTQHLHVQARLDSPAGTAKPYLYDVEPVTNGPIGPDQRYRIKADSLATVDSRYRSAAANQAATSVWFGSLPWEPDSVRFEDPLTVPTERTEYLTGNPAIIYQGRVMVNGSNGSVQEMDGGNRYFHRGRRYTEDWFGAPIAPGIPADTGIGAYPCGACRSDDTLVLFLNTGIDSIPEHQGFGWASNERFQLYQGNTRIADLTGKNGGTFQIPAGKARYRLVYDQTNRTSHTEWTFSSEHSGKTTVPDRWFCHLPGTDPRKDCSAVSLLMPHLQIPQGMDNRVRAGAVTFTVHIGHTPGAASARVTRAAVSVSYDSGRTWQPVTLAPAGNGSYQAHWNVPSSAAGHAATFKTDATDAAGNTVTQTLTDAVPIAGA